MVNNTNIIEDSKENQKQILGINNFENVLTHNVNSRNEEINTGLNSSLNSVISSEDSKDDGYSEDAEATRDIESTESTDDNSENIEGHNKKPLHEVIDEGDVEEIQTNSEMTDLLQGGKSNTDDIIYTIEYILEDDEKLINPEKIYQNVDKYINNYNSDKVKKYKNDFKQLYQTYSNKNYIIETRKFTTTYKITVIKNDKSKKIVKELVKPLYMFYNEDNNILKMKRNISNSRTELLYKYEKITSKLNITPEEKKEFEKERSKFIEMLEDYYTYTLYHKKINKINTLNKSNLILQKELTFYRDNNDYESKILNSNMYSIDNNIIDTINKYNSENLVNFNNIILTLSGKKEKDINKDKKTLESIKSYIKQRQEIESFTKTLTNNTDIQDEYINYIILEL